MPPPAARETGLPEDLPIGLETEYAFNVYGPNGEPMDRARGLHRMLEQARRQFACLTDSGGVFGVFLSNGARLYIDAGSHPEYSTPECAHPRDLVLHSVAGDLVVHELATAAVAGLPGASIGVFRANVDYTSGATWGCHESYLHRGDSNQISTLLIPHLASRIVYTGAGGFQRGPQRTRFVVSPRVGHLTQAVSDHSTERRGIFHTKDEPLCSGGYHRLHVICGESLCSQIANFVRVGATALVVRLILAGVIDADRVVLRSGLAAIRVFAEDPRCTKQVSLANGNRLTAIELQRTYLQVAEDHIGDPFMPRYAEEVCTEWRRLLDLVALGPEAAATTLDWAIKYALFIDHARKRGTAWSKFASNPTLSNELFEIDTRFGELGEHGIFRTLDAAGALHHTLRDLGDVARATCEPPNQGRARIRGARVRDLSAERARYQCSWDRIIDLQERRNFDMSDPFGRGASWKPTPTVATESDRLRAQLRREMRARRTRSSGSSDQVPF